jgi:hypothetical protein
MFGYPDRAFRLFSGAKGVEERLKANDRLSKEHGR